ncbi:MAG: hypothetical protein CJBNEKGG_04491 [Prosthecobacter sp.]|nr:hypothetical protein [Prosthecobacter sp.]
MLIDSFGDGWCFAGGFGRSACLGPFLGREACVVLRGHCGHPGEHVAQILKGIDAATAAGFDHREHDGAAFTRFRIADEQPVFLAHGGRADGVLDRVGIDLHKAVTQASRSGVGVNGSDVQRTREGRLWLAGSPESLAYDEDGNLTSDGRWTYAWDAENRLKSMETQSAAISAGVPAQRLEFAYDAQGRRVRKVVRSLSASGWVVTSDLRYLYDGWNLIAEMDVGWMNGYLGVRNLRSYAWGYDLSSTEQGAGGVGGLVLVKQPPATVNNSQLSSTSALAPCYDGNGNILAYMDCATGAVVQRMEYDAFGNELSLDSVLYGGGSSTLEVPFRFSTKYTDAETNLSYYGFRYYSAEMGRWLSRDPIEEEGGINLYGMVRNDTVQGLDNLGLCGCTKEQISKGKKEIIQKFNAVKQQVMDAQPGGLTCISCARGLLNSIGGTACWTCVTMEASYQRIPSNRGKAERLNGGFSNHVWLTCVGQNVNGGDADTLTLDLYLDSDGPSDLGDLINSHEYDQFRILDALTPNGTIIPIQPY